MTVFFGYVKADENGKVPAAAVQSTVDAAVAAAAVGGDLTGTVANAQIAAGAVGLAEIADLSITGAKIAALSVSGTKLTLGTVGNTVLSDMTQSTIKGRAAAAGTGQPTDLTPAQVAYMLSVGQLARADYTPGITTNTTTSSTTLEAVDATNLSVTFTAPASGKVRVDLEALAVRAAVGVLTVWGVIDDSAVVVADNLGTTFLASSTACSRSAQVTGLTPGASYTWRFAHRAAATGTATTSYTPASAASIVVTAVP